MRKYELALILAPDLGKEPQEKLLTKIKKNLEEGGGKVEKEEEWGKKELSYRIKKEAEGFFVYLEISLPGEAIAGFEQKLKLEEKLLRYLLVRSETPPRKGREKKGEEVKKEKSRAKRK